METRTLIFNFADAIQKQRLVLIKFRAKDDGQILLRKCAPLDIAPSRKTKSKNFKFHLWDFDGSPRSHTLSLDPDQIIELTILDEQFQLGNFISWDIASRPWCVKRDWGKFS